MIVFAVSTCAAVVVVVAAIVVAVAVVAALGVAVVVVVAVVIVAFSHLQWRRALMLSQKTFNWCGNANGSDTNKSTETT